MSTQQIHRLYLIRITKTVYSTVFVYGKVFYIDRHTTDHQYSSITDGTMKATYFVFIISLLYFTLPSHAQQKPANNSAAVKKESTSAVTADDKKQKSDKKNQKSDKPSSDEAAKAAEEKKKKNEEFEKKADLKKAEWIENTMEYGIQKDRKDAINFIPTVKDPGKKALLENKLTELIGKESDSSVLVKAVTIAAELKLNAAIPNIQKLITSDSEDVRIAAVYSLKDLKAVSAKNDISDALKKQDFSVDSNFTEAMIQTLADFGSTDFKDFAIGKIKDNKTTRNIRLALLLFLGRSGAKDSSGFLLDTFKDPNEEIDVRSYSVNSLARLEIKEAVPEINKFLDEYGTYSFNKKKQYNSLYLYSVSALVKLGDEKAYSHLQDALKNDNPSTRLRAIKLLKDMKDKRSIDILKYKMQYDPSVQVQKAAKEALTEMGVDVGKDDEPKKTEPEKNTAPAKRKGPSNPQDDEQQPDDQVKKRDDF